MFKVNTSLFQVGALYYGRENAILIQTGQSSNSAHKTLTLWPWANVKSFASDFFQYSVTLKNSLQD